MLKELSHPLNFAKCSSLSAYCVHLFVCTDRVNDLLVNLVEHLAAEALDFVLQSSWRSKGELTWYISTLYGLFVVAVNTSLSKSKSPRC